MCFQMLRLILTVHMSALYPSCELEFPSSYNKK